MNPIQAQIQRDIDRHALDPILSAIRASNPVMPASTSNADFITAAATATGEQRTLWLDDLSNLTTPDILLNNITIASDWRGGFTGSGWTALGSYVNLIGLLHVDQPVGHRFSTASQANQVYSKREKFIRCTAQAFLDSGAAGANNHVGITIEDDYFEDCGYAILGQRLNRTLINRATIRNLGSITNYGIELNNQCAGVDVVDIDVIQGRSGVVCLPFSTNGNAQDIRILGGKFRGVAEESVSLGDCRANQTTHTGLMDFFVINGTPDNAGAAQSGGIAAPRLHLDWSGATIQTPASAISATLYANRDLVVLSGANRGLRVRISGSPAWAKGGSGNSANFGLPANAFTQAQYDAFANGDKLAIYATATRTQCIGATFYLSDGGNALLAWGSGGHRLNHNIFFGKGQAPAGREAPGRKGLVIQHVSGIPPRSTALALSTLRSQAVCYDIQANGNKLFNCDISLGNHAGGAHSFNTEVAYDISVKNNLLYGNSAIFQSDWVDIAQSPIVGSPCFNAAGVVFNSLGLPIL